MFMLNGLKAETHYFSPHQRKATIVALQIKNRPIRNKEEQYKVVGEHLALIGQFQGRADAVFLPEISTLGYPTGHGIPHLDPGQAAERLGGPIQEMFSEAAKRFGLLIGFGLPLIRGSYLYESYVVTDRDGRSVICDKAEIDHITYRFEEGLYPAAPGRGYASFKLNGLEASLIICRDFLDEQLRKKATRNNPVLLVMPCYTMTADYYSHLVETLPGSLLTINYAEEECGQSTIYEQSSGGIIKTSLDRDPGAIFSFI